jgi:hypothetical protein
VLQSISESTPVITLLQFSFVDVIEYAIPLKSTFLITYHLISLTRFPESILATTDKPINDTCKEAYGKISQNYAVAEPVPGSFFGTILNGQDQLGIDSEGLNSVENLILTTLDVTTPLMCPLKAHQLPS